MEDHTLRNDLWDTRLSSVKDIWKVNVKTAKAHATQKDGCKRSIQSVVVNVIASFRRDHFNAVIFYLRNMFTLAKSSWHLLKSPVCSLCCKCAPVPNVKQNTTKFKMSSNWFTSKFQRSISSDTDTQSALSFLSSLSSLKEKIINLNKYPIY